MRIGQKISCMLVATGLVGTALLTSIGYTVARTQYFAGVDRQLTAAAAALPPIAGEAYLHRALTGELSSDDFDRLVYALSDLADESAVYYIYAFALEGDTVVHLATSATEAERATKDWGYRKPYEEPPAELLATFADGVTRFAEYTDEYGSFRSIFVSHRDAAGGRYIVGADVALSRIHADLRALVWRYLGAGGLVAAVAGLLGIVLARRISVPIRAVADGISSWSRRDFAADDAIRDRLAGLARRHRDESGDLAARFVDVQDRLQSYLSELTATTAAKQKIEQQIAIARSIQEGLLPTRMPAVDNFRLVGWSQPADQTGGDFFDVLELPDGFLLLTLGDVTGHGIGPALLACASRAYARATIDPADELDATIGRLNELLHSDLRQGRFVTLVACVLDPARRRMKLVAAGHGPILVYSRRRDTLDVSHETHGLPLGISDEFPYETPMDLSFEPGDALVLVSDGFFEWHNAEGKAFGLDRLADSVLRSCREEPDRIIDRLRADLAAFHGGTVQMDDTTALVIQCVA